MTVDIFDVNAEFEKLFGVRQYPNIFDSQAESVELRQLVLDSPQMEWDEKGLPFDGIELALNPKRKKRKRISTRKKELMLAGIVNALQHRYEGDGHDL